MGQISAILDIADIAVAESIFGKISNNDSFTNVVGKPFSEIVPTGLVLLCLHNRYHGDPELFVCILKKQSRIATAQVRLKGLKAIKLEGLTTDEIINRLPSGMRNRADAYFVAGYQKFSARLGEEVYHAIKVLHNDLASDLDNLFDELKSPGEDRASSREEDAAIEKDALGLSLDIFGVERSDVLNSWKRHGGNIGNSFLAGLKEFAVYEDDVINYDLHQFPGFDILKPETSSKVTGVVEFESQYGDKLTVINANRKPMEKAMGVDLIYFHRRFESFIMIQYKMMDQRSEEHKASYYNPNQKSHNEELERLKSLKQLIHNEKKLESLSTYRFSDCSLFFKLCKKIELKMDDHSLAPGMYIPLTQWELLLKDDSTLGKKGGRQFGYHTLNKRYMNKDTFVDLVQSGFIGTTGDASIKIAAFLEDAIKKGKSVMYAIDDRMSAAPSRKQSLNKPNISDQLFPGDMEGDDDLPF